MPAPTVDEINETADTVFDQEEDKTYANILDKVKCHFQPITLSEKDVSLVKDRFKTCRSQPNDDELRSLVDKSFVEVMNKKEEASAIINNAQTRWVSKREELDDDGLFEFTAPIVEKMTERAMMWKGRRSNGIVRYKQQDSELVRDRYYINTSECAEDDDMDIGENELKKGKFISVYLSCSLFS